MQKTLTWGARIALIAILTVCLQGALDPYYDARKWAPPADAVMHVIYGYLLTLTCILALPKVRPMLIGGFFLMLGVGLEALQAFHIVSGTFQLKDLASNVAGVLAALLPLFVAGRRAR